MTVDSAGAKVVVPEDELKVEELELDGFGPGTSISTVIVKSPEENGSVVVVVYEFDQVEVVLVVVVGFAEVKELEELELEDLTTLELELEGFGPGTSTSTVIVKSPEENGSVVVVA